MKKRGLWVIIGICILVLGGIIGWLNRPPDPTKLVTQGLERLNAAASFRYTLIQYQWVEGKNRVLAQVQGESDQGNTRVVGELTGGNVELVKIGDSTFSRDPFSKKWIKFADSQAAQEVFLAELSPLSSLKIKELGEVVLSGQDKVNGDKVWVCQLKPTVDNQTMETYWTDFHYTLYVRKSDKTLVKATIEATNKARSDPMTMTLEFRDIGKKITIETPTT